MERQTRLNKVNRLKDWYVNVSDEYALNMRTGEKITTKEYKRLMSLNQLMFLMWW